MNREDKNLLFKDLCARLPYGVCVHIRYKEGEPCYGKLTPRDIQWFIDSKIENIKPYLRPMSSMTEDEYKEAKTNGCIIYHDTSPKNKGLMVIASPKGIDWLNKKMFAYRTIDGDDMFELGIALEAPEGMYDLKKK